MKTISTLLFFFAALLSAQTRSVVLTWGPSTSTGVTGYILFSSPTPTGTFTPIGCTGTVNPLPAGVTACVSGTTATTTTYTDSQPTGTSVSYQAETAAAPCTPTTPVTQGCGVSGPSTTATTTVPPKPTAVTTVVLTVQ